MRILSFILLVLIALTMPFPVFLFFSFLYLFFWTGYELLVLTVFIDSFFGLGAVSVRYTLSIGVLLIGIELLRPYLSWYMTRI